MKVSRKTFESDFFGFDYHALELGAARYGYEDLDSVRAGVSAALDATGEGVYEVQLDARQLFLAPALEDLGFRLWDSRFEFLTRIDRKALPAYGYDLGTDVELRAATPADRPALLALNRAHLVADDALVSKFKAPLFGPDAAGRWFDAWVENSLDDGAACSVLDASGTVTGFFIYARRPDHEGVPLYKGVLCVVDAAYRGRNLHLALQEFIFMQMLEEDEFFIDNTTQISNLATFRNHFHSRRVPAAIRLVFLLDRRKRQNGAGG